MDSVTLVTNSATVKLSNFDSLGKEKEARGGRSGVLCKTHMYVLHVDYKYLLSTEF